MNAPEQERPVPRVDGNGASESVPLSKPNTSNHNNSDQLVNNIDDWRQRIIRDAEEFMRRRPTRRQRGRR